MGVPALFRWLNAKYPKITTRVVEQVVTDDIKELKTLNTSLPNPNGIEFDNLYLDMNGIIHPCCHPEFKAAPETEEDMFLEIYKYIDRIFAMVRPRSLLYMAIDGVAPRAKMNQQRSRRFRAAQEATERQASAERMRSELRENGVPVVAESEVKPAFDSNCITPGTQFMAKLTLALQYYIVDRLNNDPGWSRIEVILSDASVPGEGEHKIMDFIRHQRASPHHDANTRHVIYGLDADLIMLALATHEPYFTVLREDVLHDEARKRSTCFRCGLAGHQASECTLTEAEGTISKRENAPKELKPFVFLDILTLREYLNFEFSHDFHARFDFERMIDDWVFLCFFVGNDFLPHLPSMEIREGAIDLLLGIYKKNFHLLREGYLTDEGHVNVENVKLILEHVGAVEDAIFQKRRGKEEGRIGNAKRRKMESSQRLEAQHVVAEMRRQAQRKQPRQQMAAKPVAVVSARSQLASMIDLTPVAVAAVATPAVDPAISAVAHRKALQEKNMEAAIKLKMSLLQDDKNKPKEAPTPQGRDLEKEPNATALPRKRNSEERLDSPSRMSDRTDADGNDSDEPFDNIRLWELGAKERYYVSKFKASEHDREFVSQVARAYMQGLCWVMAYYYRGCVSWNWFYPYHYAPFASDFTMLNTQEPIVFELGKPFSPFEQLLGVLPAASRSLVPKPYHRLMTEPDSELIDFYPEVFPIDMNGKKHAWQGVALLPFIEQERLVAAAAKILPSLSESERQLNTFGLDAIYLAQPHPTFDLVCSVYSLAQTEKIALSASSAGVDGFVSKNPDACMPGSTFSCALETLAVLDICPNESISAQYLNPLTTASLAFSAKLLPGVQLAKPSITREDFLSAKFSKGSPRSQLQPSGRHSMYKDHHERMDEKTHQQAGSYRHCASSSDRPSRAYWPPGSELFRASYDAYSSAMSSGGSEPYNRYDAYAVAMAAATTAAGPSYPLHPSAYPGYSTPQRYSSDQNAAAYPSLYPMPAYYSSRSAYQYQDSCYSLPYTAQYEASRSRDGQPFASPMPFAPANSSSSSSLPSPSPLFSRGGSHHAHAHTHAFNAPRGPNRRDGHRSDSRHARSRGRH